MNHHSSINYELSPPNPTQVLIYEYGARLDKESARLVQDQLTKAHRLYNSIIAAMQETMSRISELQLKAAGEQAESLNAKINGLDAEFLEAKSTDDKERMRSVANDRREARRELWALLKEARPKVADQVKALYASIGRNSACISYELRCDAVADGLGWATANATLDAALDAWKKSTKRGRAPRFSKIADKMQQSITLQFTKAGGVKSVDLLSGGHRESLIHAPAKAAPRQYGTFQLRLGPAKSEAWATGTWQYHRSLPADSSVGLVRLVVRRQADKLRYAIQMMVKLPEPIRVEIDSLRKPLAAIHLGWAADKHDGRRIGAVVSGPDPGLGTPLHLPADIEADLKRSDDIQSQRDDAKNLMVERVKAEDVDAYPEEIQATLRSIRKVKNEYTPPRRLYFLARQLIEADRADATLCLDLLAWRKEDRKVWQARDGIARTARNRRKEFYRDLANELISRHSAIAFEHLDLAEAAEKVDTESGEKTDFTRAARAGRFVASLSEFGNAIKWACTKTHTPLLLVSGSSASVCPYCSAPAAQNEDNWHESACTACAAVFDRKLGAAAVVWQAVEPELEALRAEHESALVNNWTEAVQSMAERKEKMATARAQKRQEKNFREHEATG